MTRHGRPSRPAALRRSLPRGHAAGAVTRLLAALPGVLALLALAAACMARAPHALADGPHADVIPFRRDVDPAAAQYVANSIDTAEHDGATLIILEVDTDGGDTDSMRQIVQRELASTVPIVAYVAPSGAHAGSAGAFLVLAAPVAAMAPNTDIGASSPIDIAGQDLPATLDRKLKNDLESLIGGLQTSYGRNPAPAIDMVENARAFNERDALSQNVVNLVAGSRADLLAQLDGYTGTFQNGASFTLHTAGLPVTELAPSVISQVQTVLYNPTIDFILFIVAALCIYLELAHPGAIVPGTVGGIAFILFLFGAQALNPNWTGLALMLLAILLLAVDIRVPTHGVLTIGALISLVAGALIFFDSGGAPGAPGVPPIVILGFAAGLGVSSLRVLLYVIRSGANPRAGSVEGLIGQTATVIEPLGAEGGRVRVQGENWAARLALPGGALTEPLPVGASVRVKEVDGLTLIVEVLQG